MSADPNFAIPAEPPAASPAEVAAARRSALTTWLVIAALAIVFVWRYPGAAYTTVAFIVVLSVLVFVHEWGHYQFALWGGMKVNRFGIGFPPWIYTKRHNGIDYSIGALPIGGMVDIAGLGSEEEMVATAKDSTGGIGTAGTTVEGVEAQSAARPSRMDSYRHRRPERPHGEKEFQDATLGWRFWTLFAGPLMNFLFAMIVFVALFSFVGVPDREKSTPTNEVDAVSPGSPAEIAGIQSGDRIVGINGQRTTNTEKLRELIAAGGAKPLAVAIERKGEVMEKTVHPEMAEQPTIAGKMELRPMIGVQFHLDIAFEKVGFVTAIEEGWKHAFGISAAILGIVKRAVTFNLSKTDKTSIGGPVRIAQEVGRSAKSDWRQLAIFAAGLSVNLGLLNLLPLPALDGGRILFLGYELLMGRPLDPKKEGLVHMAGMALLLALMLFITLKDVLPYIRKVF